MRESIGAWSLVGLLAAMPAVADSVSFSGDVVPVLNAHCVACHLTGLEQGELALHARAAYDNLVGVPARQTRLNRVEPGVPERSYLYLKLVDSHLDAGGEGEPMPMGSWPMDSHSIALFRDWIAAGARRD